jgi:hypothetical protein
VIAHKKISCFNTTKAFTYLKLQRQERYSAEVVEIDSFL